jgi:predicted PurR-regulated permease PerM
MPLLDTDRQRAVFVVILLGLGLVIALAPYVTGLIGAIVLYVVFAASNQWLRRRVSPTSAATIVVVAAVLIIVLPSVPLAGAIVGQAQDMARGIARSPVLDRIADLRIGSFDVGAQLAALGETVIAWLGTSAFSLIGTATRFALNLSIALFGLFFLCLRPDETWESVRPYIPFSPASAEKLRNRFRDVTTSTLIGTGLKSIVQGALVATGFLLVGLPNAAFWGVMTAVFAILPVVGSGLIWVPAAVSLALTDRWGAAVFMALWGLGVGNVDNVIRPMVFRRWAQIHPFVTLVGALGGVRYFGILGLLIGPLAVSYFFELIRMYREEYLQPA